MQRWMSGNQRSFTPSLLAKWVVLLPVALLISACGSTSVTTPLPDLGAVTAPSMTPQETKKAVNELNSLRATHEQDAVRQIEQAR